MIGSQRSSTTPSPEPPPEEHGGTSAGSSADNSLGGSHVLATFEEHDYEDLAARLFPRMLDRIKRDLHVSRERSGRL